MAGAARKLSQYMPVIEPFQTAKTIEEQVEELKNVLEKNTLLPVTLVGFSWGGWLSLIFASEYPEFIKRLVFISSAPFEQKYAEKIMQTRLSRLDEEEKSQVISLIKALDNPGTENKNQLFAELGRILSKADAYDPIKDSADEITYRYDIFQSIWSEAEQMRKSGELLKLAATIQCPVTAIHGDYDPHPAEGVQKPLSQHIKKFKFILLPNCGHKPWLEKQAKEHFYSIIKKELV
ncbi:MAG: alpha/beta hydrolase [Sedimentisphaerales bacterium]